MGRGSHSHAIALLGAALFSAGVAACEGCRSAGGERPSGADTSTTGQGDPGLPTARLYVVSDLAGALEPCGCTKHQLGGMDHAAAWLRKESVHAPNAAVVEAGPLFFMDPVSAPDKLSQDVTKAETIAAALKTIGFAGFAPGANDWAGGADELTKLADASGGAMLFANASNPSAAPVPFKAWSVREIGGIKIGLLGVTLASADPGSPALPFETTPPAPAITAGIDALKKQGAHVFVALAAIGRGPAKRLADDVPALTAIVVGSSGGHGEANAPAPPAERIGNVLLVQAGNHLTSIGALDLYVKDGSFTFADGTGLELEKNRGELDRRIAELRARLVGWEADAKIQKADLDARRAELAKLEADRKALASAVTPPKGSFFRWNLQDVEDSFGSDATTQAAMGAYYKQVNEHNRVALAGRMPRGHTAAEPTYVGLQVCTTCHKEPRAVWDKTRHAHAYETLEKQSKNFNLDCVSCHVTGYEQPGGSTVTHVERLKDVQCEVCHGPGSKHALDPTHVKTLVPEPKGDTCLSCHHPPHVEGFDPDKKMSEILGPGHGL